MDAINLDTGFISGIEVTEKGQKINIFRGIPYAAPPTGNLRWKPPEPPTPWPGVRECTRYSIQAAQYRDRSHPAICRIYFPVKIAFT
jgi:para-nitrobenzyl esterase